MVLDQSQITILEKELDHQYVALLEDVRKELATSDDRQYVELTGHLPADNGEASMADVLAHVDGALFDRHINEIRDIEAATRRIRKEVFGVCIDCEEHVPFERLKAYPTAKRCDTCQITHERTFMNQAASAIRRVSSNFTVDVRKEVPKQHQDG